MKVPRCGSTAKAWTLVRMPERTRKVPTIDIEKATTASIIVHARKAVARGEHGDRMEQRGRRQPGHERGVLDRVPEPPAAPAELVIGPVAARGDARASGRSRRRAPRAASPGRRPAPTSRGDKRADREGESDREADIAEVERRRMEGQAGVLKQRIEAPALRRRRREARERVRGEQQEGIKAERRSRPGRQAWRPGCAPAGAARAARPPRRRGRARSPTAASSLRGSPRRRRTCRARACAEWLFAATSATDRSVRRKQQDQGQKAIATSSPARSRPAGRRGEQFAPLATHAAMPKQSWSSDSAAASHSAARPASAIIAASPLLCLLAGRARAACSARHAWRGSCRRRNSRPCWNRPSATTPLSSRNRSGRMPRKRTWIVVRSSVVDEEARSSRRPPCAAANRASTIPPSRIAWPSGSPCPLRCRRACRNRRPGPSAPTSRAGPRRATRSERQDQQDQALVFSRFMSRSFRASAASRFGPAHRRSSAQASSPSGRRSG